jgi:hypothetical protein
MEDINDVVKQISEKMAFASLKQTVMGQFASLPYLNDDEMVAYMTDTIRVATTMELPNLIKVWFKEWKTSKEPK